MSGNYNGPPRGTLRRFDLGNGAPGVLGGATCADFTCMLASAVNLDPTKQYEASLGQISFPHPGGYFGVAVACDIVIDSYSGNKMVPLIHVTTDQASPVKYFERTGLTSWTLLRTSSFSSINVRLNYGLNQPIPTPADPLQAFTRLELFIREVNPDR